MLYSFNECLEKYNSGYKIRRATEKGELYKIMPGIYSDRKNVSEEAVIVKKYPNAVFTLNSAFYYQGLTDTIPSHYYLLTDKDAAKISDKSVKQSFDNNSSLALGVETISYDGTDIRVFSKERLIIELIRNRSKLPYDYYREVLLNYRKIIHELNFSEIAEYAEILPKSKMVIETIQREVL